MIFSNTLKEHHLLSNIHSKIKLMSIKLINASHRGALAPAVSHRADTATGGIGVLCVVCPTCICVQFIWGFSHLWCPDLFVVVTFNNMTEIPWYQLICFCHAYLPNKWISSMINMFGVEKKNSNMYNHTYIFPYGSHPLVMITCLIRLCSTQDLHYIQNRTHWCPAGRALMTMKCTFCGTTHPCKRPCFMVYGR